ncbi:MAG: PEP-CTERM sorting domain-containing protein [Candidatus Rokubacteria bacterium]|nr:PEP-CTERM sorting domain-containing protein [Candidatus Rokubacteria bacterium]
MVLASDQGFSQPAGPVTLLSELGGTTQGTVSAVQGIDTLDELFGLFFFDVFVIPIFQGPLGPGPFADTAAAPFGGDPSFSITDAVTVTHAGAGQITSFNILSSVVPEPASLLLLGSGLVGLALYGRRRLK